MATQLPITQIQRYCVHDGPGIRTTVFLKGCPLRCAWCHNPETQAVRPQVLYTDSLCIHCQACASVCPTGAHRFTETEHRFDVSKCTGCLACASVCPSTAIEGVGRPMTIEALMKEIEKDRAFYGETGGLTLSGGEPLLHKKEALELLRAAKAAGLHTAVETCGFFDGDAMEEVVEAVDLFLWDYKDSNPERHEQNTGVRPEKIWENLRRVDALGGTVRLRCLLIHDINTEETHYRSILQTAKSLRHCEGVELLRYHAFGGSKMKRLGYEDNGHKEWIPTEEDVQNAKNILDKYLVHGV
jgi:pyruvate formate lyase activating enzyme